MSRKDHSQLFLVIQSPRPKYRAHMSAGIAVVYGDTKADAIQVAATDYPNHITTTGTDTHNKPKAQAVGSGTANYT